MNPLDIAAFEAARARVLGRIAEASAVAGRDPGSVTLVAISKTVPADRLQAAVAAGLTTLGENRVQEATDKVAALAGVTWHLVGPLQSNKARRAIELFDVIESVDSVDLGVRLDRLMGDVRPGARLPILLQVNVDDDPAKAGFEVGELPAALDALGGRDAVDVRGLMTIGRLVADPQDARRTFSGLRELSDRLRASGAALGPELSMGMSDDYPLAVQEGATIVRVGRALFGERRIAETGG